MNLVCLNGTLLPADVPVLTAQNRSFKWGDGIFETIKVWNNQILLEPEHFERLFSGLTLLNIQAAAGQLQEEISKNILLVCQENNCTRSARVRLALFRDENNNAQYLIEAAPLEPTINEWSTNGLVVDIYPYARKSMDAFSNLKSASYLPYVLAAAYAKDHHLDDVLVLNHDGDIADSSRANVFLIKNEIILTPPLQQGCINGVMRRFLIDSFKLHKLIVQQKEINEADLLAADEVFLTNCIQDIRWVSQFRSKVYGHHISQRLYHAVIAPLYNSPRGS